MSLGFRNILYESAAGVAKISINHPPLNVLNTETLLELTMALEKARTDSSVSIVVITGVGDRAFSAGVDIRDHLPDKVSSTLSVFNKVFYALRGLDKPSVAVVNGVALGGGCELAMGCDLIIASEKAQFGQPEITVGAIPPVAVVLLPRLVGPAKAFELILTGDVISAAEAKQIGLVNKVVPQEKLEEAARELVAKLKDKSPVVLRLARMSLHQMLDANFKKELEEVTGIYLSLLMRTEDAVEGLKAFMEKRKPQWKGK
ncbi:MAG TPA: enoyl-CoA hydratase/isomerase family protein [Candidatus Bathyarchaeia archaeon]|nr:enoyl-CoA hydratase/isomerase family protein [Candidatus Bathyarchaeia archaeon]